MTHYKYRAWVEYDYYNGPTQFTCSPLPLSDIRNQILYGVLTDEESIYRPRVFKIHEPTTGAYEYAWEHEIDFSTMIR